MYEIEIHTGATFEDGSPEVGSRYEFADIEEADACQVAHAEVGEHGRVLADGEVVSEF